MNFEEFLMPKRNWTGGTSSTKDGQQSTTLTNQNDVNPSTAPPAHTSSIDILDDDDFRLESPASQSAQQSELQVHDDRF